MNNVRAKTLEAGKQEYLAVYDLDQATGKISRLKLLEKEAGEISLAWEMDQGWSLSDLLPYSEEELLLATSDKGWLFLDLHDFSVEDAGVGGPYEADKWAELGRPVEDGLVYNLEGVGQGGAVLASVEGSIAADDGERHIGGTYHQIWVPSDDGLKLVAENVSLLGEGGAYWAFQEKDELYVRFESYPGTPYWLSWQGPGEIDARDAGGYYSVVQLDEQALQESLKKGAYGDKARIDGQEVTSFGTGGAEEQEKPPAPLSHYFQVRKPFGYLSNSGMAKLTMNEGLDLLLQRSDGVHLMTEREGKEQALRIAGPGIALGTVDEKRRECYFLGGGKLFRLSYQALDEVDRQTVFPAPETRWFRQSKGSIMELAQKKNMLFYLADDREEQSIYIRALEKTSGEEKWDYKLEDKRVVAPQKLTVLGDTVSFVDDEANLHVIRADTGELKRKVQLNLEGVDFFRTHFIDQEHVYISGRPGDTDHLFAFDLASGEKQWDKEAAYGRVGNVTLLDGCLYLADGDLGEGYVYKLDPETGQEIERHETGIGEGVSPLVKEDLFLSAGYGEGDDAFLYALDWESGQLKWKLELGYKAFLTQPAPGEEMVYTVSFDYGASLGGLLALDWKSGEKRWVNEQYYLQSDPVYQDGLVFISDKNRYLYALDAGTGEIRWKYNPGLSPHLFPTPYERPSLPVVAGNGTVYFAAGDTLQAVE